MSPRHSLVDVPPTFPNRLDQHVKDVAIAMISVCLGVLVSVESATGDDLSNMPTSHMPDNLVYAMGALVAAGGILSMVGLLVTRKLVDKEYRTERTGEIFQVFGWLSYAGATTYYTDGELGSLVFGFFIALSSAWRWRVVGRIEKYERAAQESREREKRARAGRTD